MSELTEVRQAVEDRLEASTSFLSELVKTPSLLGSEEGAQILVEQRMREIGFNVRSIEPDAERLAERPESGFPLMSYAGRRCLIGELPGTGPGILVLNGHVDVVSPEPQEAWQRPPFGGVVEDGRLYGRGAADMKGGIAAMLLAVEAARSLGPLPATIIYQSVIEEETTGNGAVAACLESPRGDAALIAEPTSELVVFAGVGVIFARITVAGEGGHAMSSGELTNPIDEAYKIIGALRSLEQELNERPDPEFRDVERPYLLNVGALHAGDWPASVPEQAVLDVRLGLPIALTPADAQERLSAAVKRVSPNAEVELRGPRGHGYAFDPEAPFLRLLRDCHQEFHGAPAVVSAPKAANDLRLFQRPFTVAGGAACYGPIGGNFHGVDEWVDLASVADTATVMALMMRRWRGEKPSADVATASTSAVRV